MKSRNSRPESTLRLTNRDKDIIEAIYACKMLLAPQISARFFPPKNDPLNVDVRSHKKTSSRCRDRLRKLCEHDYLTSKKAATVEAGKPHIYFLGPAAIPILADRFGVLVKDINWRPRDNDIKQKEIQHLISTNDFRLSIGISAINNEYSVVRWVDERYLRKPEEKVKVRITIAEKELGRVLIPDGYFHLYDGKYGYHHFLEIDRGTETVDSEQQYTNIFVTKIKMYSSYYASGQYQSRYGTDVMRVLTVTTSQERMRNMLNAALRVEAGNQFWFTTFDKVTPRTVLNSPIWRVPGGEEKYPLVGDLRKFS